MAAICAVFLGGHLPWLAPALEDIDSVNFALGVRQFDVASHQPHPPGSPVLIVAARASTAVARWLDTGTGLPTRTEARGLAFWGALLGALSAFPLWWFFRALDGDAWRAALATALTLANPLIWVNAARPMSDVPGFAVALVAQALLAAALIEQRRVPGRGGGLGPAREPIVRSGRFIVLGALVAGLAIGLRSQTVWLTLPMLLIVLLDRTGRDAAGGLLGGLITFSLGVLAWLVPLVVVSGGVAAYVAAFSSQAGEDLAWVDLLAKDPTPRHLAFALLHTLVFPWVSWVLAAAVLSAAVVGLTAGLVRARGAITLLAAAALPYFVFHLFLQETLTTRYALPLIPAVAWLAVRGLSAVGPLAATVGTCGLVVASLAVGVPATIDYGRVGGPVFRAVADVEQARTRFAGAAADPVLALHHAIARAVRGEPIAARALPSPAGREWTHVVDYWLQGGTAPVWFLTESRRTDLRMFDPAAQHVRMRYGWPFDQPTLAGGVRPRDVVWVDLRPPGWFVTDGWALTPELAGLAERERRGPSRGGVTAWVRRRPGATWCLVGGRNLGEPGEPDVRFTVAIDNTALDAWTVPPAPGFFLRTFHLPDGRLAGDGFARLTVVAEAADGSGRPVRASVEQFDVQPDAGVVWGFDEGWHEAEYAPATGLLWRWTSDRASIRVLAPAGRELEVTLRGEDPRRYFDRAPEVRLLAGSRELARFVAHGDFLQRVTVPSGVLSQADPRIVVETSETFVPDERTGNGDRRRLGLRVFDVTVRAGRSGLR